MQAEGVKILSSDVCVEGSCCVVCGGVVEGLRVKGIVGLSCVVCVERGSCVVSGWVFVGMQAEGIEV